MQLVTTVCFKPQDQKDLVYAVEISCQYLMSNFLTSHLEIYRMVGNFCEGIYFRVFCESSAICKIKTTKFSENMNFGLFHESYHNHTVIHTLVLFDHSTVKETMDYVEAV